jgi:hypothetical protein
VLSEDLLRHISNKVDFGVAMTPTEETAEMYRKHMPDAWIYNAFSQSKVEQMLAMQRACNSSGKMRSLYLICDDCGFDKRMFSGSATRDLFMNGRHVHMTYICCLQYVMDMSPDLRTQVDYVFALKENIISNKQKLWRYFFGMFDRYEDFSRTMDRCTEHYGALVLDNTAPTSRIEDSIFWYRGALEQPPFKMGKPIFYKLAARHTKSEKQKRLEAQARLHSVSSTQRDRRITSVERTDRKGKTIPEDLGDGDSLIIE